MRIKHLEFTNRTTDWHLENTELGPLDLLVGRSGAGKSMIIEALERVVGFATSEYYDPGAMEWTLAFEHEGIDYCWEGCTAFGAIGQTMVMREKLSSQGKPLVERTPDDLRLSGKRVRKQIPSVSALVQLSGRKQLRPVVQALEGVVFVEPLPMIWQPFLGEPGLDDVLAELQVGLDALKARPTPLSGEEKTSLSWELAHSPDMAGVTRLIRMYLLQELALEGYQTIKQQFIDIFPWVEDVRVFLYSSDDFEDDPLFYDLELARELQSELESGLDDLDLDNELMLDVSIRERGQDQWRPSSEMSASMLRTLAFLVDLQRAIPGTVLVIDDIESDLGADALPRIVDLLLERADCQIIMTSKQPGLLERIPVTSWKLVQRDGSYVDIEPVSAMANLGSSSHGQALARLLQRPASPPPPRAPIS